LQGDIRQNLERELGDFILRRRDGYYSYQLAVVVDDALQGITDVCRGTDLMDSTPRQVYLQGLLGYPQPSYLHLPIAVNELGQKLSKQTFARPLAPGDSQALSAALAFLGHPVPAALVGAPAVELIAWGVESWNLQALPKSLAIPSPA
jgi:glutamyl-Q tRNA(Asp) synthetase